MIDETSTLRDRIAAALRPHASLGGTPPRWELPFFDGATPSLPRISGWRPLDEVADAVLAVLPAPTDTAAVRDQFGEVLRRWGLLDEQNDQKAAEQFVVTDLLAVLPLSPYYEHPACGLHWHGRDGMDIPVRDGQPVCPRCELAKAERKLAAVQRRREEVGAECKRRGKRVLEQSEQIRELERQIDEVRRQLGEEILRADHEAGLRRLADETQDTQPAIVACDREAVLNKAALHLYTALFPAVYADMGQKAAEGVNRAVSELRRLADEQPEATPRSDALAILTGLLHDTDRPDSVTEARVLAAHVLSVHTRELSAGARPVLDGALASPLPTADALAETQDTEPATGQDAAARVRTVLETEAVTGRTALEYRGLILAALMADEQQPAVRPDGPADTPTTKEA